MESSLEPLVRGPSIHPFGKQEQSTFLGGSDRWDRRDLLFLALVIALMLSGVRLQWLNQAGSVVRQISLVLIGAMALRSRAKLPSPLRPLAVSALIGVLVLIPQRTDWTNGVSFAVGMLLLHYFVARSLNDWLIGFGRLERMFSVFLYAAVVFVAGGFVGLSGFAGDGRFSGASEGSSVIFALTGAGLLPALLWWVVYTKGRKRTTALVLLPVVAVLVLMTGQRSGVVAMITGVVPFVVVAIRLRARSVLRALAVCFAFGYVAVTRTTYFDFAFGRYRLTESSSRLDRWEDALPLIFDRLVGGWGVGFTEEIGFGVHNAFLAVWLELGLIGLILWISAILWSIRNSVKVLLQTRNLDPLVAVSLSWIGMSLTAGMVENKLYRPTNFPALIFLLGLLLSNLAYKSHRAESGERAASLETTRRVLPKPRIDPACKAKPA